jgi:hypothetical protein
MCATDWPTGGGRSAQAERPNLIGVSEYDEPGDDPQLGWLGSNVGAPDRVGRRPSRGLEEDAIGGPESRSLSGGGDEGAPGEPESEASRGRGRGGAHGSRLSGRGPRALFRRKRATAEIGASGGVEPACRGDAPEKRLTRRSLLRRVRMLNERKDVNYSFVPIGECIFCGRASRPIDLLTERWNVCGLMPSGVSDPATTLFESGRSRKDRVGFSHVYCAYGLNFNL